MPTNPAVRAAIARLARSPADLEDSSLDALIAAARDAIPGADFASINLLRRGSAIETLAATDDVLVTLDQVQNALQEGPCFDAATEDRVFIAERLKDDPRWPRYGQQAADLGLGAQMTIDLHHPSGSRATLNLYSRSSWVFVDSMEMAELFADHASVFLGYAEATEHFQAALGSRKTIGQALGVLMERYQIGEDRAFQFLVRISSESKIKLREVAADVVAGLNRRNKPDAQLSPGDKAARRAALAGARARELQRQRDQKRSRDDAIARAESARLRAAEAAERAAEARRSSQLQHLRAAELHEHVAELLSLLGDEPSAAQHRAAGAADREAAAQERGPASP